MSLTEIPETKPGQRLSIENVDQEGKVVYQKGGSAADEREMSRMGKRQELRVFKVSSTSLTATLTL